MNRPNRYPATEWLVDGNLVYRLDQYDTNYDEIRVSMCNGTHGMLVGDTGPRNRAIELAKYLNETGEQL
jgi:hypothetical protein